MSCLGLFCDEAMREIFKMFGGFGWFLSASYCARCSRWRCLYILALQKKVIGQLGQVYSTSPVCVDVCSCTETKRKLEFHEYMKIFLI